MENEASFPFVDPCFVVVLGSDAISIWDAFPPLPIWAECFIELWWFIRGLLKLLVHGLPRLDQGFRQGASPVILNLLYLTAHWKGIKMVNAHHQFFGLILPKSLKYDPTYNYLW